jgi:hypothetical protein
VVTEPPATVEEEAAPPPPLTLPPPTTGEATLFRKLRQRPIMSIDNIQDFYLNWSSPEVNEAEYPGLLNNPADMARDLLKQQNEIFE